MKTWHVTCTCATLLLFPLDRGSCFSNPIGWVGRTLFVLEPFVLWGWRQVANYLQRDPFDHPRACWWFPLHLFGGGFLLAHLERCVWPVCHRRGRWTCLLRAKLGFFLGGLHPPTGRKGIFAWNTWRIISRGFFLNGTWSWLKRCSSDISSCLGVVGSNTDEVDVWRSLSNGLHLVNRRTQNNPWRDTCGIPNDPIGCRFLFFLKLDRDERSMEKGWLWVLLLLVVKGSCRVLRLVVLVLDWRGWLGIHRDRIRRRWCLWRRRRLVTIFSLQSISYMFLHQQTSGRERSVLVLVFQEFLLTFTFQSKRSHSQGILFFMG